MRLLLKSITERKPAAEASARLTTAASVTERLGPYGSVTVES